MKHYNYTILMLLTIFVFGCQNAAKFNDVIYITGTEEQSTVKFIVEGPSSMGITVTSSDKVKKQIDATLKVCPDLLKEFNEKNGRSYQIPPEGSYSLENGKISINENSYVSSQSKLSILSTEAFEEGVTYCIPISIVSTSGSMSILESSKTVFVVINQVIHTKAADLSGSAYYHVPSFMTSPDAVGLRGITMECKVYVNSFCSNNPFISSVMGIEENFLLRFGDVSCDNNQLQLSAGRVGGKSFPMTGETHFSTGRWYHIAVVYDGKTLTLYVDGKKETYATTSGGTIDLNSDYYEGFYIGKSERGRYLNGYVSEARVWNIPLTANQMQENICYVDPTSKGLIAYWRFNGESQEGKVMDLTGHGHDAIARGQIKWVDMKCPF